MAQMIAAIVRCGVQLLPFHSCQPPRVKLSRKRSICERSVALTFVALLLGSSPGCDEITSKKSE
jgi:hypothetical protein